MRHVPEPGATAFIDKILEVRDPWASLNTVLHQYPGWLGYTRWLFTVVADPGVVDRLPASVDAWDRCLGIPPELTAADRAGLDDQALISAAAQLAVAVHDQAAAAALARLDAVYAEPGLEHHACAQAVLDLLRTHGVATAAARRRQAVYTTAPPLLVRRTAPDTWCVVTNNAWPVHLDELLGAGAAWAFQAAVVLGDWPSPGAFTRTMGAWAPVRSAWSADMLRGECLQRCMTLGEAQTLGVVGQYLGLKRNWGDDDEP